MLDLLSVQTRIQTACPQFLLVAGSAAFDMAVSNGPTAHPAAYVFPLSAKADAPVLIGAVEQRLGESFGVAICLQNVQDARGDAAMVALRDLRLILMSALIGFKPAGADGLCAYTGGRYVTTHNGFFYWQDDFACDSFLRIN
jgi:hypothetical protein